MTVAGAYDTEINTMMGKQTGVLTLKPDGNLLSGNFTMKGITQEFSNGSVSGDKVAWTMILEPPASPVGKLTLEFEGTVSENEITGNVKLGAFGSAPFKGTRVKA